MVSGRDAAIDWNVNALSAFELDRENDRAVRLRLPVCDAQRKE